MTINLTAYGIEIVRAGIEAAPAEQREAGPAPRPEAICRLLQDHSSTGVGQYLSGVLVEAKSSSRMLESAVVSQIAVTDLTHVADFIQSRTYRAFETYFAITLVYLSMAVSWRWLFERAGRRLFTGRRR